MRVLLPTSLIVLLLVTSLLAQVGDPTLRTDHPVYPGVGAFQTVEDCVAFATAGQTEPQEKAIALYNWLLTHQWHLASPQEWCIPGRTPDTAISGDYENVVYDANIGRFSYGYGLCGTVHAWNEPYWNALGMPARRRAFPGHTNSEIYYDGGWHAFDTDMAGLLFRKDGVVAGYADIIADPSLVDSTKPPLPHYPFAWPGDFNTMKKGWQQVAAGGNWYSMYNGGYAAQPGIVHLRKGETFTRYYNPDHYGGPSKRRFWHNMQGGPHRPWSFYGQQEPHHDGEAHNARNDVSYCNGEFVYRPEFNTRNSVTIDNRAMEVFSHWSPYVIAGDPADDTNPMTGPASGGLVVNGHCKGTIEFILVSQAGKLQQLTVAAQPDGRFQVDLTDFVKGRFDWKIAVEWDTRDSQLNDIEFTTVTQVCPSVYPSLTTNGCDVNYRAASRAAHASMPDFRHREPSIDATELVESRSGNITYQPRSEDNRVAFRTTDNKPGAIVFQVDTPGPLIEVRAAVRYQVRVPPPEEYDYHLDISTDDGKTWRTFAQAEIPSDNEHSSGWLAGNVDVSEADVKRALVRVHLYAGGHKTGLIDARLYGIDQTPDPGPLTITYGWKENGESREYTQAIPAGTTETTFTVPTRANIRDDFIRLSSTSAE